MKCGALYEWTSKRRWIGILSGVGVVVILRLTETALVSYWLSIPLALVGFLVLLPLIPGQHCLAMDDNEHNQMLKENANSKSSAS